MILREAASIVKDAMQPKISITPAMPDSTDLTCAGGFTKTPYQREQNPLKATKNPLATIVRFVAILKTIEATPVLGISYRANNIFFM